MNKYLKNLNRIEFLVTRACTGNCKHCSQGDHKGNGGSIDKEIAADAVCEIAGKYNIQSIMTFGGEPLLFPDTVCAIHFSAKKMNIPKRQLITNGYFSKDNKKMYSVAEKLAESGVNDMLLSVDAFHQETIPVKYVKEFAMAVKRVGIYLRVHPAWLVSRDDDNRYNSETKQILEEFISMGFEQNKGNVVFPKGNALKYLKEYFDLNQERKSPYWENPEDMRAVCFDANGDVLGGNIYRQRIDDILSAYNPEIQNSN